MESARREVAVRAARRERRPDVDLTERAVLVDADDVAEPTVVEMGLATVLVPLDRHRVRCPPSSTSTDHDARTSSWGDDA
jgi:hypothetical protein